MTRKYKNQPQVYDGHHFDSKRERDRYAELKLLERAKEIEGLMVHPRFPLTVKNHKICAYVADFEYVDRRTGERVVEDVKGVKTAIYKLKKKLMAAILEIEIQEVV